jgi:isopentenyl diphosphate isomerase/L-lactate dehydrogenase-like FMN-dependent dehydrogenase
MKKLLCLAALFFITAHSTGQSITPDKLEGNWRICAFDINGITWDFKTDVITLPQEYDKSLGENQKQAMITDIREGLKAYKDGSIAFKTGNYIEQSMAGEVASGIYSIENKNGLQYLKIVNDDAQKSIDTLQARFSEGKLYLTVPDEIGGKTVLTYCK